MNKNKRKMDKPTQKQQVPNEDTTVRSSMECLSEEMEELHIHLDQLKEFLEMAMVPDEGEKSSSIQPNGHACQLVYNIESQIAKAKAMRCIIISIKQRLRL